MEFLRLRFLYCWCTFFMQSLQDSTFESTGKGGIVNPQANMMATRAGMERPVAVVAERVAILSAWFHHILAVTVVVGGEEMEGAVGTEVEEGMVVVVVTEEVEVDIRVPIRSLLNAMNSNAFRTTSVRLLHL